MIRGDATAWLELWERAADRPARLRRRELLASAGVDRGPALSRLEIGRANAWLLHLHRSMFGSRLACHAACPQCHEALELDLDAEELLTRAPPAPAMPMELKAGEWEVSFRLPTEGDMDAVHGESDLAAARDALLRCVVTGCRRGAEDASVSVAPPEVTETMGARMEESDPLAILDFELTCASCSHTFCSVLDMDAFVWARLDGWAHRLLRDVHTLARAYGWSERAITAMSPRKRQLYLDMVEG